MAICKRCGCLDLKPGQECMNLARDRELWATWSLERCYEKGIKDRLYKNVNPRWNPACPPPGTPQFDAWHEGFTAPPYERRDQILGREALELAKEK